MRISEKKKKKKNYEQEKLERCVGDEEKRKKFESYENKYKLKNFKHCKIIKFLNFRIICIYFVVDSFFFSSYLFNKKEV